jgi:hypothetical protein
MSALREDAGEVQLPHVFGAAEGAVDEQRRDSGLQGGGLPHLRWHSEVASRDGGPAVGRDRAQVVGGAAARAGLLGTGAGAREPGPASLRGLGPSS